jgi:TonB family protein
MAWPSQFARVALLVALAIVFPRVSTQSQAVPPVRSHMTQDQLCCITDTSVDPIYPKEARLAGVQGEVKLLLVIGLHNEVAELHAVSGDPLLVDAAMTAMRGWKFSLGGYTGGPRETEVPITYTFKLEVPRPTYIHLKNGDSIHADSVREYTDHMEYTAHGRTHRIAPESVTDVSFCDHVKIFPLGKDDCIPAGGPKFVIRALPLLPSASDKNAVHPAANGSSSK